MSDDEGLNEISDALERSNVSDGSSNVLLALDLKYVKKIKNNPDDSGKRYEHRGKGTVRIEGCGKISVFGDDRTGNAILLTQVIKPKPGEPTPTLDSFMKVPFHNPENKPILVLTAVDYTYVGRVKGALPERRQFLIKFESLLDLWSFASVYHQLCTGSCEGKPDEDSNDGDESTDESYESIPETQNKFELNRLTPFKK